MPQLKGHTHIVSVYYDKKGDRRWRVEHINGEVIANAGQGYSRRKDAVQPLVNLVDAFRNGRVLSRDLTRKQSEAFRARKKRKLGQEVPPRTTKGISR